MKKKKNEISRFHFNIPFIRVSKIGIVLHFAAATSATTAAARTAIFGNRRADGSYVTCNCAKCAVIENEDKEREKTKKNYE